MGNKTCKNFPCSSEKYQISSGLGVESGLLIPLPETTQKQGLHARRGCSLWIEGPESTSPARHKSRFGTLQGTQAPPGPRLQQSTSASDPPIPDLNLIGPNITASPTNFTPDGVANLNSSQTDKAPLLSPAGSPSSSDSVPKTDVLSKGNKPAVSTTVASASNPPSSTTERLNKPARLIQASCFGKVGKANVNVSSPARINQTRDERVNASISTSASKLSSRPNSTDRSALLENTEKQRVPPPEEGSASSKLGSTRVPMENNQNVVRVREVGPPPLLLRRKLHKTRTDEGASAILKNEEPVTEQDRKHNELIKSAMLKIFQKDAEIPRTSYKSNSDTLNKIAQLSLDFYGQSIPKLGSKSVSWPCLCMTTYTESAEHIPENQSPKETNLSTIKEGETTSTKKTKTRRVKHLPYAAQSSADSCRLKDKVASTKLHEDPSIELRKDDLNTYSKLMLKQYTECVRIRTNMCSYGHVLGLSKRLENEATTAVVKEMNRAQQQWIKTQRTCLKKLRSHLDDWVALRDGKKQWTDETFTDLEHDKRRLSTWMCDVLAIGRLLDQRSSRYLIKHEVYEFLCTHRGCCSCHCEAAVEDNGDSVNESEGYPSLVANTSKSLVQSAASSSCKHPVSFPKRKATTGRLTTNNILSSYCANPGFVVDGCYDDLHIHGIKEKKAPVDVCIRKKKRWQTLPSVDKNQTKACSRKKKDGAGQCLQQPKEDGENPAGRSKYGRKKCQQGHSNKKHRR